jgi:hypothetical protein
MDEGLVDDLGDSLDLVHNETFPPKNTHFKFLSYLDL